ncbi:MAG TPA: AMP-binding protein [Spirochaetota bacterium]|nr:AMP-binding protein [Spirochaetota bacterium]HPG51121.1 AMP-binding protein [Spirochaetota bacterium]HPN10795.1 AMP-binding protein [Spirochaetota bacterium]
MNLKTFIRTFLSFVNFRTMLLVTIRLMRMRKNRVLFIFEGKEYTYGEVYRQATRYANFFLSERKRLLDAGKLGKKDRLALGIYMENTPEYMFASFAAGLSNSVLFAINTGFRGETLAKVIDQARISFLVVNENSADEIKKVVKEITVLGKNEIYCVGPEKDIKKTGFRSLAHAVEEAAKTKVPGRYRISVDNFSPVIVIYTSGTTGLPKGVPCTHIKLVGAGFVVQGAVGLTKKDRGYISMPLFHSNAWYIGILPQLIVGGSFVLKRKFSASAFETDMLEHGVAFLNYVGQPLHYILDALEKKYGSGEAIIQALANHPKNRFRIAYGNGASVIDRKKLKEYLAMDHIYEIYGSTEAVITTANRPGDPADSVGAAPKDVIILNEEGTECPPGIIDANGKLTNYDEAVGEICRKVGTDNLRFDGYFDNKNATSQKFRDGIYHSGDLGHIRIAQGKRYLFFNGRTDDWIRKDGENFSAENVLQFAQEIPCVDCAVAYGAPCHVADERVMVTVQLKKNHVFKPGEVHSWLVKQQKEGGMDPKWMPDYIRIIDQFPVTDTQKIMVKPYKRDHFNLEKNPDMKVYFCERGSNTYHPLTREKFSELKDGFKKNGREGLLG